MEKSLVSILNMRVEQLQNRRRGVNIYLKNKVEGENQYNDEDLKKLDYQIQETKEAIAGIKKWKSKNH